MSGEYPEPRAPFFALSPIRLALLSVAAGPIYCLYWSYRSWSHIQRGLGRRLQPLAQALVLPFSSMFLLSRFRSATGGWPSRVLGFLVIALLFVPQPFSLAPGPLALVSDLVFVPVLILNLFATRANARAIGVPGVQRGWSRAELVLLAVLIPLNALATYDLLLGAGAA